MCPGFSPENLFIYPTNVIYIPHKCYNTSVWINLTHTHTVFWISLSPPLSLSLSLTHTHTHTHTNTQYACAYTYYKHIHILTSTHIQPACTITKHTHNYKPPTFCCTENTVCTLWSHKSHTLRPKLLLFSNKTLMLTIAVIEDNTSKVVEAKIFVDGCLGFQVVLVLAMVLVQFV